MGLPGPPIDAGTLVFLSSADAASGAEKKLAETFVFHRGESATVRALYPVPPTAKDARSVQRVARNVVVFWQWPRRHAASSDRIVDACLAASLR
jgi:hypothetical protein